ncbi:MAG: hypothetical protein HPM95_00815 [Alphaproteobacteria bacterium]|nr:hypothetical protein [Alphaproteobacteria bacterium]
MATPVRSPRNRTTGRFRWSSPPSSRPAATERQDRHQRTDQGLPRHQVQSDRDADGRRLETPITGFSDGNNVMKRLLGQGRAARGAGQSGSRRLRFPVGLSSAAAGGARRCARSPTCWKRSPPERRFIRRSVCRRSMPAPCTAMSRSPGTAQRPAPTRPR